MKTTKENSSQKRTALGKGLASLLPSAPLAAAEPIVEVKSTFDHVEEKADRIPGITMIPIVGIEANVYQPRRDFEESALQELAESIRAKGIISPLVVRRAPSGKYNLIAGERRLRAAKIVGLKLVPVVVRQSSDREALEIALIENIQRENLNCVEIALSYFQLVEDFQLTQDEVSQRVGKNRSSVTNHIRLLKLPEEVIRDLREGKITFGHGKALLALKTSQQRLLVRNRVLLNRLSVRETEELVTKVLTESGDADGSRKERSSVDEKKEALRHLSAQIGRVYGAKVAIKGNEHRGKIVIKYFSRDDLDRLVDQLNR